MSEVIRCPRCGDTNQLQRENVSSQALKLGLALFRCADCEKAFWYNTGNTSIVVNNAK